MNQYKGNCLSYHLQERKKKNLAESCEEIHHKYPELGLGKCWISADNQAAAA